jgi:AsmA protein
MKRKGMKITVTLVAVALAGLIALPYVVDVDRFRPQLESSLASSLGRDVHVGHMELSLLVGGARVEQISVADDPSFNSGSFLQAKSLGVGVSLLSLIFSRALHVTSLTIEEPQVSVMRSAEGKWNFASLGSSGTSEDGASSKESTGSSMNSVVLDHLKITNATIEIASSQDGQPTTLRNIDVDLKNVSFDSAMSFALSARSDAGKLEIKGEAGPMNRTNPEQTPFHATIKADKANLGEIAPLDSAAAFGGILNLDATVTSDGSTVHSEGKASAEKLRIVRGAPPATQTISVRYQTEYAVAERTGVVRNSEIQAGKGSANLSGTYEQKDTGLVVHIKVAGNHMPLDGVEGVLPALGIVLPGGSKLHGGTVSANLALDGPVDRVVTSGSAQITNAHLAGFDLGSKLSALPGMGGSKGGPDLSIVNLGTHMRIGPDGTHISGLNGQFSGIGSITGDGEVGADNHLQFKMVAHVANDGAVRFGLNHVGLRNLPNDLPFQVVGTTSMPIIIPDLSGMAKNTTKAAASSAGKSMLKKLIASQVSPKPEQASNNNKPPAGSKSEQASNKKSGFLRNLFHRKGKEKATTAANSTQLAAQKSKY